MLDHAAAIRACARGDRAALEALFDAESAQLTGVALRILGRRDLAEDAVQDAFVAIWRKAGQYDPGRGSARGWIYAILRNRALNIVRDGRRETGMEADRLELLHERDHELGRAFDRLDDRSALRRCLATLDETRRTAVLMAYVFGYTHGEIAGRLDAPLGTAKAWVRRGLAALRECLS